MRSRTLPDVLGPRVVAPVLVVLLLLGVPMAGPSPAQQYDTTTSTSEAPQGPDIIPAPDSGSEPQDAGDRGGLLQSVVLVLIVVGVGVIAAFIVRDSRRSRERRGF